MPLSLPHLDDRRYQDLVEELLARVPVHTPEWTNLSQADPGVTLVQLFAYLTETLFYRANQIPERNRLKFLQLLGLPLMPGSAAKGLVAFRNERGPDRTLTLDAGTELSAGTVPFRTRRTLDVLPVDGYVCFKRGVAARDAEGLEYYRQLYATFLDADAPALPPELDLYETVSLASLGPGGADLDADSVDRSLWVALLVRESIRMPNDDDAA
ncbi:MAG: hypothetical protein JNL97_00870, partial [Verrucomicrobiales bacterium]|nr:hypothetical protein [Verrucomicrobiales bacterium]